jgi:uncharacterized membrane protein
MAAVLLLAAVLRFQLLDAQSFWNDEGNSARLSERSLSLIIEGTASDVHPPLYYLLLRGWRELAGETEFTLRALSAFLGIGLVAVAYSLGRQLIGPTGRGAALIGAFLVAVNPALIYYSQEARMYELLAFLALLSTLLLARFLQDRSRRFALAAGYVIVAAAGLYTHYFFPAVLLAQNLVYGLWLYDKRESGRAALWREARAWLLMMLATLLIYLPWLPIFFRQAGDRAGSRPDPVSFLHESVAWLAAGPTLPVEASTLTLLAYGLLIVDGVFLGYQVKRRGLSYPATLLPLALIPLLMMWLVGATQPAYFKFMLVSIPPLCLLAGAGWWWGWFGQIDHSPPSMTSTPGADMGQRVRRPILIVLSLLILWGSFQSLRNMYGDPAYARADYRAMANQIASEAHPNAAVVLNAANQWEVFTYYHEVDPPTTNAPVFPIPRGYPDPAVIDDELSEIIADHDQIYALFWGEAERDPQRLVERWLDSHAFKARDEWVGDVRFVTYAVAREPAQEMAVTTDLNWGETVQLQGYTLSPSETAAGDIVQLTLFWRADEQLDTRYKVFLHLVDDQGQIIAQRDSEPGGSLALTTTWQPGETIVDNHGLLVPLSVPDGQYTLLMGLYELGSPSDRLAVDTAGGAVDAFSLGTITVGDG